MRSKGRVGRAQAKPKDDGKKRSGRPPTYTTSSGKKVAKVKLTPTTATLASFLGRFLQVFYQQLSQANSLKEENGFRYLTNKKIKLDLITGIR